MRASACVAPSRSSARKPGSARHYGFSATESVAAPMSGSRPAHTIGRNATKEDPVKISELMSTDVVTTTPDATLRDVARMLVEHNVSGVPVCDDAGAVVGVVSQGDILFKEQGPIESRDGLLGWLLDAPSESDLEKARARTAGEAMTHPPVTAVPFESAAAAARRMT